MQCFVIALHCSIAMKSEKDVKKNVLEKLLHAGHTLVQILLSVSFFASVLNDSD